MGAVACRIALKKNSNFVISKNRSNRGVRVFDVKTAVIKRCIGADAYKSWFTAFAAALRQSDHK